MYLIHTPNFIQCMFPNFTWRVSTNTPQLYLTFDDGPIPGVTPWVLDQLKRHDAKATFFCVGENVQRNPVIFERITNEGHSLGNHTFNHLSGWANDNVPYYHNIRHCAKLVDSNLFRPPYGKIKPKQAQFLMRHYKIVMWDVLSADFDANVSPEQCLNNVIQNATPGSIIVMHDSLKAERNMTYALPRVLDHFGNRGWSFEPLAMESLKQSEPLRQTA